MNEQGVARAIKKRQGFLHIFPIGKIEKHRHNLTLNQFSK